MVNQSTLDKQIPIGFSDLFLDEAARLLWLAETLRTLFARWGYAPVIPPTVVYAENLAVELGTQIAQDMYRFFDRQGHTLALRADLTVPVARIVGTRLYDRPMPLRLCYVERVFRQIAPQVGQRREFTQAGVELVGADTAQADAEVVALAAEALRAIGIGNFRLTIGQMGFFRALVNAVYLNDDEIRRLEQAVDRRNDAQLCALLDELDLPAAIYALLRALPTLSGGREVIDRARQILPRQNLPRQILPRQVLPVELIEAELDRLEAVYDLLLAYGLNDTVLIDLGEVRGMEYYTGLVFQGYAAGVGTAVCGGGRYNDLIGHFGPSLPAVGFGLNLDLARQAVTPTVNLCPDALVQGCAHPECLAAVQTMRTHGATVIVDTLELDDAELIRRAQTCGARAILCRHPQGWQIIAADGSSRIVNPDKMIEEIETWRTQC